MATKMSADRALPPLDLSGNAYEISVGRRRWLCSFEYKAAGHEITDLMRLESLLLHFARPEVQELFSSLPELPAVADGEAAHSEFAIAKGKLNKYFAHEPNTAFERHNFCRMSQ